MADVKNMLHWTKFIRNMKKKPETNWLIYRVEDVLLVLMENVFREKEI